MLHGEGMLRDRSGEFVRSRENPGEVVLKKPESWAVGIGMKRIWRKVEF